MPLLHVVHPSSARHDTGALHPERPARLRAALAGVDLAGVDTEVVESVPLEPEDLHVVHDPAYVEAIERFCSAGGGELDADTVASTDSWEASLAAAGAGWTAVEQLRNGFDGPAFVSVRPPGHHALANKAMGFCLFNNIGVTAARLRDEGARVAIVDWDVHHGNGTQSMFFDDPDVLYASIHQSPFYPFEGAASDVGVGDAVGTTINVPVPAFTAGDVYLEAFEEIVMVVVKSFSPDWLLISAGFDAHAADPLAELRITEADYAAMGRLVRSFIPADRIVGFLEGGYHLPAIRDSVAATVRALCGRDGAEEPSTFRSPDESHEALRRARSLLEPYLGG